MPCRISHCDCACRIGQSCQTYRQVLAEVLPGSQERMAAFVAQGGHVVVLELLTGDIPWLVMPTLRVGVGSCCLGLNVLRLCDLHFCLCMWLVHVPQTYTPWSTTTTHTTTAGVGGHAAERGAGAVVHDGPRPRRAALLPPRQAPRV